MSDLIKKRSKIWNHFSIINKDKAKCEYCSKIISFSGSATGNLMRHMKKMHGTVPIDLPSNMYLPTVPTGNSQIQPTSLPNSAESDDAGIMPSTSSVSTSVSFMCDKTTPVATTICHTVQSKLQTKIHNFAVATRPLPLGKAKQLDELIIKFIVKGYHSFSIVEEEEFKNIFRSILPTKTLPSRKTISSSLITKLYNNTKVLQLIAEADAMSYYRRLDIDL